VTDQQVQRLLLQCQTLAMHVQTYHAALFRLLGTQEKVGGAVAEVNQTIVHQNAVRKFGALVRKSDE
jgi:hypothetical protein